MSTMELNKGRMKLVAEGETATREYIQSVLSYADIVRHGLLEKFSRDGLEWYDIQSAFFDEYEDKFMRIGNDLYRVEFDIRRDTDAGGVCEVDRIGENEYSFLVYEYNSASLCEFLESGLKEQENKND